MKDKHKLFLVIFMVLSLIFISACADTANEEDVENTEEIQEMEIAAELKTIDDLTEVDSPWLEPIDYDAIDPEAKSEEIRENIGNVEEKIEDVYAQMDEDGLDYENLTVRHYEDDFYVLLDEETGEVYQYDSEQGDLNYLIDATELQAEHTNYFLLARSKGDTLYLANSDYLYAFNRDGEPHTIKAVPAEYQLLGMQRSYALLIQGSDAYIYKFDTEEIEYTMPEEYIGFEYDGYIITKVDDTIYALDFTNGEQYRYQGDFAEKDMIVMPESDKLSLVDWEDQSVLPIEMTIHLPEIQ